MGHIPQPDAMSNTTKTIEEQINELVKENNMKIAYRFTFPMYRTLPAEVQLALTILEKHDMHVVVEIQQAS